MEWPKELLELFEDPVLNDVRPKGESPTMNDRILCKLLEVTDWTETNGREPLQDGESLKEKLLAASLKALREHPRDALKVYDRLKLLG